MAKCLVIELFPITEDCVICGDVSYKKGIPMYEDIILHNDYDGEWGGQPACDRCYEIQCLIREPLTIAEFKSKFIPPPPAKESEREVQSLRTES